MCFLWCHNCSMNKDLPVTLWWMNGGNLGDIWRPLEAHFRLLFEQVGKPASGHPKIQRMDNHSDRRSPSWHDHFPQSHNQRMCQGAGVSPAKAQSHTSDSSARWDREGRQRRVCLLYYRPQFLQTQSHDRCIGNSNTNQQWSLCVKTHTDR